jgi:hypothetical protein
MRRRLLILIALAQALAWPALAGAAPAPVQAWYMYGATLGGLESNTYNHGCAFGRAHPDGNRLLLLDFGAARKAGAGSFGALDFSGTLFTNGQILAAMEKAADGHHNCFNGTGSTVIGYGISNYHLSGTGMTTTDAYYVGYYQSRRAQDLAAYQTAHAYTRQSAAAAGDMEPAWDGPAVTKRLVDGDQAQGWALYYDFGSADGCPSTGSGGSCSNGWRVADVAYVSYSGAAVPLPEIYYPVNGGQWTVVRRSWNLSHGAAYRFWGSTGTTGVGLTPQQGWNTLSSLNPGIVLPELVCFC